MKSFWLLFVKFYSRIKDLVKKLSKHFNPFVPNCTLPLSLKRSIGNQNKSLTIWLLLHLDSIKTTWCTFSFHRSRYVIMPVDCDSHLLETWCAKGQLGWPFFISLFGPKDANFREASWTNLSFLQRLPLFPIFSPLCLTVRRVWNNFLKKDKFK